MGEMLQVLGGRHISDPEPKILSLPVKPFVPLLGICKTNSVAFFPPPCHPAGGSRREVLEMRLHFQAATWQPWK